ncbi:hypothetical protein BDZ45DRAFT_449520 [Acephala macrosclerotiorum]|nr:hypothetical protein BDZ45DRAFT_449520 [Acephala macrosclerotiorum]
MDSLPLPSLTALTLGALILLCTYTTYLCAKPPNPTPYDSKHRDSMSVAVTPSAIFIRSSINILLGTCHAIQCLTYPEPQLFCPNTSNLSPYLFTWTPYTIFSITSILLGSYIRLSAFSALGTDFTFRLDEPKKLVTTGLYNYVQHPSYIGKLLIIIGNLVLLHRPDGVLSCWLPGWIVHATVFWKVAICVSMVGVARVTSKRVKEEEMMLKNAFGEEWEAWHKRTKRFIPGLF